MNGSNKTTALTHDQFKYIVNRFLRRGDNRMAVICLLLGRCIRIGDVLNTIVKGNVYHRDGRVRERMQFTEQKTGKARSVSLKGNCLETALKRFHSEVYGIYPEDNLFYAKLTGLKLRDKGVKYLLSQFVGVGGIEQCSPHSFRKYGARFMFDNGVDIEVISQVLNHSTVRETRTYLDIKTKDIEKAMKILEY